MELDNSQSGVYRGTKELKAWPMTRGDYNDYRGWDKPADEDASDAGYLVEYLDGGKANDPRHSGYISWSPADVFERTYYRTDQNTCGVAIGASQVDIDWRDMDRRHNVLILAANVPGLHSVDDIIDAAKRFKDYIEPPKPEVE